MCGEIYFTFSSLIEYGIFGGGSKISIIQKRENRAFPISINAHISLRVQGTWLKERGRPSRVKDLDLRS